MEKSKILKHMVYLLFLYILNDVYSQSIRISTLKQDDIIQFTFITETKNNNDSLIINLEITNNGDPIYIPEYRFTNPVVSFNKACNTLIIMYTIDDYLSDPLTFGYAPKFIRVEDFYKGVNKFCIKEYTTNNLNKILNIYFELNYLSNISNIETIQNDNKENRIIKEEDLFYFELYLKYIIVNSLIDF